MENAVLAIEASGDADRKRHLQEQLLRVAHSLKGVPPACFRCAASKRFVTGWRKFSRSLRM
ncbi:hypothetical protein Q1M64_03875 (plasmid) [Sinorhizobium meliloti]|nr:hypothetical protein Q1M64_03875 [Sinorhizobium meliloti]